MQPPKCKAAIFRAERASLNEEAMRVPETHTLVLLSDKAEMKAPGSTETAVPFEAQRGKRRTQRKKNNKALVAKVESENRESILSLSLNLTDFL
jgi:uncharacterized surface protein with fasciclin (FAS1) repeats